MTPFLSICIPTYNHAELLDQVLARLTSLASFARESVEIVISDNASSDGTQEIAERYARQHPEQVRYFRNEINVNDENFGLALSRGKGTYLKLANDTLMFTEEGLSEICSAVRRWQEQKPVLFFSNLDAKPDECVCATLDDFIDEVSFHMTWIGSFGLWRSDFAQVSDFGRRSALKLSQVDALLRMLKPGREAVVCHKQFAEALSRKAIGGYNLAEVFGRNYFFLLNEVARQGRISRAVMRREKYRMLRRHILPFYLSFSSKFQFPATGYVRYLLADYWTMPFFWLTVPCVVAVEMLKNLMRRPVVG